jgi:hypothetical protein
MGKEKNEVDIKKETAWISDGFTITHSFRS